MAERNPDSQVSLVTEHLLTELVTPTGLAATVCLPTASYVIELPRAQDFVFGRDAEAGIQLKSNSVSRRHARLAIDPDGEGASISDLGSRNGTLVNGERIDGERRVGHGDEVQLGDVRLLILRLAAVPADALAVVPRDAFAERLHAHVEAMAGGEQPLVLFVIRLPARWDESLAARRVLEALPRFGVVGLVADDVVGVSAPGTRESEARDLVEMIAAAFTRAGIRATVGVATYERGASAEDLVDAALAHARPERATIATAASADGHEPLAVAPAMKRVRDEAARFATSPLHVLLVGETGVGKEVFARFIHKASGRAGRLVAVNAAALPEALLESELFGHERGAFSGANQAKVGLIEAANGGTLFLDEIGELPMSMQAKLLRVLEDFTLRRVGSTVERRVDVRVVSATNRDLEELVRERRFRPDLLFRLNACVLNIPPLRERRPEIRPLAAFFLARATPEGQAPPVLAPEAIAALEVYDWPGNIRELRNVMARACAVTDGATIHARHLPDSVLRAGEQNIRVSTTTLGPPPSVGGGAGGDGSDDRTIRDSVRDYERDKILAALDQSGGNTSKAAAILGIPRRTLAYRMKRLGITF